MIDETKIMSYENMVYKCIKDIGTNSIISRDDLYQEGMLAVCEAISSYDSTKGTKESTWVMECMQGRLKDFLKKNTHAATGSEYVCRKIRQIRRETGKDEVTPEDLEKKGVKKKTALRALQAEAAPTSFEELEDYVGENEEIDSKIFALDLNKYLEPEEVSLVEERFGYKEEPLSYKKMAEKRGTTPQAIRRNIEKILRKMRNNPEISDYRYK